jgi:peptide/nickel transport system permease protein
VGSGQLSFPGGASPGATRSPIGYRRKGLVRAIGRVALRRLAWALPVFALVSVGLFVLGAASPFDPVRQYAGARGPATNPEVLAQIRANWGLDRPLPEQYLAWVGNVARGDLGPSRSQNRPVSQVIVERAGWSVLLVSVALVVMLGFSLVLGTVCAWFRDTAFDRVVVGASYVLQAAPSFWLGLAAIWVFAIVLGWLPAGGLSDLDAVALTPAGVARHLLLPAAVLAVSQSSWVTLFVRETVLSTLREDFVTGARARGLAERTVVFRHALRSALLPYLTLAGTQVPELVTGAILVETVFNWPGLGSVSVQAAMSLDFPLLAAITLLATVAVIAGNLAADVAYAVADPRVRADG